MASDEQEECAFLNSNLQYKFNRDVHTKIRPFKNIPDFEGISKFSFQKKRKQKLESLLVELLHSNPTRFPNLRPQIS
jgi:hypothetical protein